MADNNLQVDPTKGVSMMNSFITDCMVALAIISRARGDLTPAPNARKQPVMTSTSYALAEVGYRAI